VAFAALTTLGACASDDMANTTSGSIVATTTTVRTTAASTTRPASDTSVGTAAQQSTTTSTAVASQDQGELDAALIAAAWDNDVERARQLIARGANVNAKDSTQQSAYLIAASEGYDELLDLTFQHGADVRSLDSYNGTGLIRAAERGHAAVVGRLLREGIDVDHVNRLGWTALHEAIILGTGDDRYVDTVRLLVAGRADLELRSSRDGVLPLEHAESRRQTAVATTLSTAFASQAPADPNGDLLAAAISGDADAAAIALRHGADIETRDDRARTPLLLAVTNDSVAVARLLVGFGANPNAVDAQQDTPWLVTGVTGSVAMVDALLPAKPDFTIRNRFGGIAIIPASERGHVDYVRRVAKIGMNVNHVNNLGWTALLEAVILGNGDERYQEIVCILLDAGADRSIADRNGVTALEHARSRGFREIERTLETS
jgi:ankyrin repeat protein